MTANCRSKNIADALAFVGCLVCVMTIAGAMPAFAQAAGGMLTDAQIDVIAKGIRSWSRPKALDGAAPPPYSAGTSGDSHRGEAAFGVFCASCHGSRGEGTAKGSAITNDSFLALVSDQLIDAQRT